MKLTDKLLPPGYSWRELWLPELIIPNTSLLGSIHGGHALALTGALLSSTVNGLEMRGAERITITDPADIHINDSLTVVLPAFILPTTFAAGAPADMGLMNLNNGAVIARLNSTTGALDFIFNDADGGVDETVSTTKVSWAAGTLWQVAFTFKFAPAGTISVRLYINGVAENTNDQCDQVITVPAGNTVLGEDLTTFFTGKFQRVFLVYDTTVLTEAQLLQIYRGIPYATNLKAYLPMDHPGRALTMPDRSVGGNCPGTISGTAITNIWDFDTRKLAALSLDGINDLASGAGADISGDITLIWAGKILATQDATLVSHQFINLRVDGNNRFYLFHEIGTEGIIFNPWGSGASQRLIYSTKPTIGDYKIYIGSLTLAGVAKFFVDGVLVDSDTGIGVVSAAAATIRLGATITPAEFSVDKAVLVGTINGVPSNSEAKTVSRIIDKELGFGLNI